MSQALSLGEPVELSEATTLADGVAVRRVGELTLANVEHYVDDIVTVSEEQIANAILTLLEQEKTVAEGAGAAPVTRNVERDRFQRLFRVPSAPADQHHVSV